MSNNSKSFFVDFTMNTVSDPCMGCLSVDRKLHPINEDCKQTYFSLLDTCNHRPAISLCFECVARLKHVVCFKQQVKHADAYLNGYTRQQNKPKSLSKLGLTKLISVDNHTDSQNVNLYNIIHYKYENQMKFEEIDQITNDQHTLDQITNDQHTIDQITNDQHTIDQITNDQHTLDQKVNDHGINEMPLAFIKVEDVDNDMKTDPDSTEPIFTDSDDEPLTIKSRKNKLKCNKKIDNVSKKRKSIEQPSGIVNDPRVTKKLKDLNIDSGHIALVMLSWQQVEEERRDILQSVKFSQHAHTCRSCCVGYNHIHKLIQHNKKHSVEAGNEICDICTIRCRTKAALASHKRRHRARWVCLYCNARYSQASVAADHSARTHNTTPPTHKCPHCAHVDNSLGALRMHIKSHSARPECTLCGKSFRDKSSLRTHAFVHKGEKEHACSVCDKKFMFKKQKEIHEITHLEHQHLYCHKCDVSFKNQTSYYQHMKYNLKHINPADIKHVCPLCDKRFVKAKRLEEHNLAVHLKLAPIKCTVQDCTFACPSRGGLRSHVRLVHRGANAIRNHVCHKCGHTYKSKKSLDSHLRSHNTVLPSIQTQITPDATLRRDA